MNHCVNDLKWRRLALFSTNNIIWLLRGTTWKIDGDFYCLNFLHSFRTKSKIKSWKKCVKKYFCGAIMPSEDTKLLEFKKYPKTDKTPSIIHEDLESSIIYNKSRWAYTLRILNVYDINVWWYRKQAWYIQRWRLHEKVLWRFNENN